MVLTGLYRKYRLALAASAVVSTLFSLGLFFTDLFIRRIEAFFWGKYSQYGPLGYAFVGFFIFIMVTILRLLWHEYQHCTVDLQKKRYRGLLIAFIGGYLGSVDFLPAFGIPIYPFGYLSVGFFIAAMTYVILRYRLVDITPELAADRILETMQGAVIVTGVDGRIRVINSNALEMLGYLKSELLGRDLIEVLPIPSELIASVRAEGRAVSREMTWQGRTGQHIVNLASSLLTDKRSNEPIGIVYAATDITERKRAEEALQLHEERLRMAMDATRQGWFDLNVQTGEVSISPEYARMIGYEAGEFQSNMQAWLEALHPDDRSNIMNAYQQCLATGGLCTMEYRRRTKTGAWKWIRSIGKVIESDAGGKPLRMIGTHTDISDRKHTEDELQRSEQFNKRILDSVDEGFIVVDRDYRILTVNKAYCDQVGMPSTEVVGNHCYRVSHKRDRPCHEEGEDCAVRKVFETGTPHTTYHMHGGPKVLYVETKAFPLSMESGTITSVIESVNNITEKHLLETERLKTQKLEAIGTLAGGIAHDFNNLLQGVFGYISLAKLTVDSKEKTRDSLEQAEKALHMSVKLTNQLLTFSKGGKPVKKRIDFRSVLEDAVKFALSGSRSVCDCG
jgi:PAS domain S-box-containing protein